MPSREEQWWESQRQGMVPPAQQSGMELSHHRNDASRYVRWPPLEHEGQTGWRVAAPTVTPPQLPLSPPLSRSDFLRVVGVAPGSECNTCGERSHEAQFMIPPTTAVCAVGCEWRQYAYGGESIFPGVHTHLIVRTHVPGCVNDRPQYTEGVDLASAQEAPRRTLRTRSARRAREALTAAELLRAARVLNPSFYRSGPLTEGVVPPQRFTR